MFVSDLLAFRFSPASLSALQAVGRRLYAFAGAVVMADSPPQKKRRGRRPTKVDVEARLQRSRQSARECRARKKMRYKSLEDIVATKEAENLKLREDLEKVGQ